MSVFEINRSRKDAGNLYKKRKLIFAFDENGEYSTENAELIVKLKRKFQYDESEIKVEENLNIVEESGIKVEINLRHCKKCDFTCETQGELLKHYREQHIKGGD